MVTQLPLSFFATLFGMNAAELNAGNLTLTQEFTYMFPISAGIIVVSFFLAFSRSAFTNSLAMLLRSASSFAYNIAVTWVSVKTGFYVVGRGMEAEANRLRNREAKIRGLMKAEVMRKKPNLEKMQAANTMRELALSRSTTGFGMREDQGGGGGGVSRGRGGTPFSPYSPRNLPSPGPASPFARQGAAVGIQAKGLGIGVSEYDVELGERIRDDEAPGSLRSLVPRRGYF